MLKLNIQLFAEGGETGAESGEKAAAFDVDAEIRKRFPGVRGLAAPQKQAEADKAPEPDAGKGHAEDAGQDAAAAEPEDKPEDEDAVFQQFLKDHPEQAKKWSQGMINDRFKNHNAEVARLQGELDAWKSTMKPYLDKLKLDGSDLEAVQKAVWEDQSNFRAYALEHNVTIPEAIQQLQDQYKADAEKAETERRAKEIDARAEQQRKMQIWDGWAKEADDIRKQDPSFDLRTEIETNPEFAKALDNGMSVTFAYRATHYDANMAKIAGAVEKQTALNTANRIAAGRNRPAEGGLGSSQAVSQKSSVADLSDKEFLALLRKMGF